MTWFGANSRNSPSLPRLQGGQALTEMAILAVVLVPLFLLIPMLGRYTHLQQVSQQAARGAAWEATVVQDYERAALDVQQEMVVSRYFNAADVPIISSLPNPQAADMQVGDAMFNTFSDQPLVERGDPQLQPYAFEMQAGMMAEAFSYIPEGFPVGPPSDNGLVTAELVVRPQNLKTADGSAAMFLAPFDQINLEFTGSHTLLFDSWSAAGSGINKDTGSERERSVWNQVHPLVPSAYVGGILPDFGDIPFLGDLPIPRIGYGQDVVDVVPNDRLEPYTGAP